jgi:Flp pilus assembly protein TadD
VAAVPRWSRFDLGIALCLLIATAFVYLPVRHHDFINYDDPVYVTENPHVLAGWSTAGVTWAAVTFETGNWLPLTWLSHMSDVQLFGVASGRHHVTSVLIHLMSTLLLFALLRAATGARWPSALVAFVFGVHPIHVESVAWVAERKDVLCGFFWMLSLWVYVRWARRPAAWRYALLLATFTLGVMSKSMIVTLPFVLLLLDAWPLDRLTLGGRLIREKLPLLALSAGVSGVTFVAQRRSGSVVSLDVVPYGARIGNACTSYLSYLRSFVWPGDLAVFYPFRARSIWYALLAAVALAAISAVVLRAARRRPYLAVGWLWYLGTLVPVIGLVQIGAQARADRYTYIPLVGVSIVLAWGLADLLRRWPHAKAVVISMAGVSMIACAIAARVQVEYWRDSESLYRHAIDVTTDNYLAYNNLGTDQARRLQFEDARLSFEQVVRIRPDSAEALNNLGDSLLQLRRPADALVPITEAVRLDPDLQAAYVNLGAALTKLDRVGEAADVLRIAVRRWPADADAQLELGVALDRAGHPMEALPHVAEALRLNPANGDAHHDMALLLVGLGRLDQALAEFTEAVRLQPTSADAHFDLGNLLASTDRMAQAIAEYSAAVRIAPTMAKAHANLGSALAATGRLDEAIVEFSEAIRLEPDSPEVRRNLAYATALKRTRRQP